MFALCLQFKLDSTYRFAGHIIFRVNALAQQNAGTRKKLKPQPFGRYLLLDRVAAGGMAEVYRAKTFGAEDFQRIVAIKKILAHVAEDTDFITMFKDEAKITVLLQHANIGQVYELGKIDETYYIAMEYVPGKDVKTLWKHQRKQKQPLPIPLACYIVQNMCEGLDYAHRKKDNYGVDLKIVHRDVSPQNVLVSWEGEVKVIDFGIAKAAGKASKTQAGILKGKFGYMAPEQVRGTPIDQRADVFAIGIVLYELLTGKRAFKAESDFSLLEMVRNVELTPPTIVNKNIPDELEKIVFKALAKDPDDRYQWATDLSEALQRFMLLSGKPANRMAMGKYLRENFTVDYDRERLRMESYRDIEMPEIPKESNPQPAAAQPAPIDRGSAAVLAALADEGGDFANMAATSAFAPSATSESNVHVQGREQSQPSINTDPGVHQTAGDTGITVHGQSQANLTGSAPRPAATTGFRPALKPAEAAPAPAVNKSSGALKYLGISLVALVLTVALGLGASVLLIGKGTVLVSSSPPDSVQVLVDGELKGSTRGGSLTIPEVKAGPHNVVAQKPGYLPFSGQVSVAKNATFTLPINLEKRPDPTGKLDISSTPAGASIFINGHDSGKKTPALLENIVADPAVKIQLKLKDYDMLEKTVAVQVDQSTRVEAQLHTRFVKAYIDSVPSGAQLYVNGKKVGKTPHQIVHIDPEDPPIEIKLKHKRCKDYVTRLPVVEGEGDRRERFELKCR